jgi:long-chain acyl-CoA synthetase
MMFDGYATPPLAPAETVGQSICVGDLGEMRDGYLYLLGRDDRVVTIADVSVPLDDIESQLQRHPNVLHAAVLTRQDRLRGLGMYAMIKTKNETDFLGEILNQAHVPTAGKFRRIIRIADWPTTAGGKTDYKALEAVLNKNA